MSGLTVISLLISADRRTSIRVMDTIGTPPGRAYVETYGCQMNVADGELMEGILSSSGYELVCEPAEADLVLVNTCAIREHAERRVLGRVAQLKRLKQARPEVVLGVTGCMAQRMGSTLLERAPYVDLVMGPDGYRSLPERISEIRRSRTARQTARTRRLGGGSGRAQLAVLDLDGNEHYEGLAVRRRSGTTAWVSIQRGCNHRCTFCIVPYVRGPEKNRAPDDVLREVAELGAAGVTEVTLLGQTVNSYRSGSWSFPRLLSEVARVDGIRRVRFTSPHPNDVTPELVEVMANEPGVCEQLHLPLQSGSNRTLRRMLRRHTVESFLETVERVRDAMPDIALSTDVIVAFPGESDGEFRETLDVLATVRFDEAFTYKYSLREGTPASRLPVGDFLPAEVAQSRLVELIELTRGIQREVNLGEVGRVEEVMVDAPARRPGQLRGRTRRNKVVAFPAGSARPGDFVTVELTGTSGPTFSGRLLSSWVPASA